ncbi:MAG TPA: matrixin family metalloprotease, partial [Longimicrobiales bacterium]|nr:matrixin family metalloprotease [Longimicrobiales bacterium]
KQPPVLSADHACRDVAYLCADLAERDRIQLRRWKDHEGTLVVHVPLPEGVDRGAAQRLQWAATAGIRLWNGQPYPIAVDERGTREAHVQVRWVSSLDQGRIGVAHSQWSPRTGLQALSIDLALMSPFGQGTVDAVQLRLTAAHEMGHILGLPHSEQPRDVMYPTNTASSLSARDHRTLEALYQFEDGTEIVR